MTRFKRQRRTTAQALFALALLPAWAGAQTYPSKSITPVVPFAAGGGGGSIGANVVAKAQPNGHTLLLATSTFITRAASDPARLASVLNQENLS